MISNIGKSAGGAVESGIKGDVSGALNSAALGAAFIPGAGNILSTSLTVGGAIAKNVKDGNTSGIVGDVGSALGKIVPG